jgi:hypothetical protein
MRARQIADARARLHGVKLISTDVFDTLLLRGGASERSRLAWGERRFSALLAARGRAVPAEILLQARLEAQRLAFRALEAGGHGGGAHGGEVHGGEVRLADVVARQLAILGLPRALLHARIAIEVAVEMRCLSANRRLAAFLRERRAAGTRVVAISDTTLPAVEVSRLIARFHGEGLVDRVYASADAGLTKRGGALFRHVAAAEGIDPSEMLHIGDDPHADVAIPDGLGVDALHLPRARLRSRLRKADGAATEAGRALSRRFGAAATPVPAGKGGAEKETGEDGREEARFAFGRDVLGPIVTQFCLRIWLYADQAAASGPTALLFCSRGGIGIRHAFERVLERLELELPARRENLMVSRLVAARAALLAESPASQDELRREFTTESFADAVAALAGRRHPLPEAWSRPFDASRFPAMLRTPEAATALTDIEDQNALFSEHLNRLGAGAARLILCDTGLYGSTQRLLKAGFPELSLETVQFARANYKRQSEEHFGQVAGLVVERDLYSPFAVESCVLRYWQLIESLFEPQIASVKLFHRGPDGAVSSNAGPIDEGAIDPCAGNALLSGALAYIGALSPLRAADAAREAGAAWRRLGRAVKRPDEGDLACLDVGARSVDFGRAGVIQVIAQPRSENFLGKLRSVGGQRWREGAIARQFPRLKPALLAGLEAAHAVRALSFGLRR